MNAARKNGGEGGGPRRLYKLVGGLVVVLAIAAALVPLWLGGGSGKQPRVVEVQPDVLRDGGTERSRSAGPKPGATAGDEGRTGDPAPDGGQKWWQSEDEPAGRSGDGSGAAGTPTESPSAGTGQPEARSPGEGAGHPDPQAAPVPPESGGDGSGAAGDRDGDGGSPEATEQVAKTEGPYWTVMVGSFRNPDNAAGLRDRLRDQGFAAHVVTKTVQGQEWNRVYAGREGSRQGAQSLMPRLKEAGYEDMLVLKAE